MVAPNLTPAYDEFVTFLLSKMSPEEILAYKASPEAQARAEALLEINQTRTMTATESAELEQIIELDLMIGVLKARAARTLKGLS
jgi:hypothetical protein